MSRWQPTMYLEMRDGVLFQQWQMTNHHGERKLQWRPVRGQGQQPLGSLERPLSEEEEKAKWEFSHGKWADVIAEKGFDPSD